MVDFKYHVVSIVAVFLALAVGIVLGTNVLSGDVLKNLKAETSQLRKDEQDLRTQTQQQQAQLNADQTFAQAVEPVAVGGRLAGQHVVVVLLPNSDKGTADALAKSIGLAGATVTAEVSVQPAYVDPQQASTLDSLVRSLAPSTLDLAGITDPDVRAASVLSAALLTRDSSLTADALPDVVGSPGAPSPATTVVSGPPAASDSADAGLPIDAAATEVLAGLGKAGFVKVDQQPTTYADLAVLVAPAAVSKPTPADTSAQKSALALASALGQAGVGDVVVGPTGSAETGGTLNALRGDSPLAKVASGIDDADTAAGRIATVLALADVAVGRAGQYGTGAGAQAPLPGESATPTATP